MYRKSVSGMWRIILIKLNFHASSLHHHLQRRNSFAQKLSKSCVCHNVSYVITLFSSDQVIFWLQTNQIQNNTFLIKGSISQILSGGYHKAKVVYCWWGVWPYSTVHQVYRPGVLMDRASAVHCSVIYRQKPAVVQFFLLLGYKYHVLRTSFIIRSYSTQKNTRIWRGSGDDLVSNIVFVFVSYLFHLNSSVFVFRYCYHYRKWLKMNIF